MRLEDRLGAAAAPSQDGPKMETGRGGLGAIGANRGTIGAVSLQSGYARH